MTFVHESRLRVPGALEGRTCGECAACCTVMAIPVLAKPARRACDHVRRSGCGIYDERPEPCRDFHCLWLRGAVGDGEESRPDALGVLFDQCALRATGEVVTVACELWAGAAALPEARRAIEAVVEAIAPRVLALSRYDGSWSELQIER
ncbi:MAG: hypothetical protein JNK05_03360 [Myxococcales bacterium]|nr:hypothetical protein [Myxococcales bacterium]